MKNKRGLKTSPRCAGCGKEMFPDVFRFRGLCPECFSLYKAMERNIRASERILQKVVQDTLKKEKYGSKSDDTE